MSRLFLKSGNAKTRPRLFSGVRTIVLGEPMSERYSRRLTEIGKPLVRTPGAGTAPGPDEATIEVAGRGVCHTDLGFFDGASPPSAGCRWSWDTRLRGPWSRPGPTPRRGSAAGCSSRQSSPAARAISAAAAGERLHPPDDARQCHRRRVRLSPDGTGGAPHPDPRAKTDGLSSPTSPWSPMRSPRRCRRFAAGVGAGDLAIVVGTGGIGSYAVQIGRRRSDGHCGGSRPCPARTPQGSRCRGSDRSRRPLGARGQRPGAGPWPPPTEPPPGWKISSAPGAPPARRPPLRCW